MGLTHVSVIVGNPADGGHTEEVRCLVDSGAVYSLIPEPVLQQLGIKPHSTREFILTNGDVRVRGTAGRFDGDRRRARRGRAARRDDAGGIRPGTGPVPP
ncbi:MAG: aspartyl protease family protein [Acidobacteria bacterium]|nr:aspartyl protease family protein [Acidobacteriota bacterium]